MAMTKYSIIHSCSKRIPSCNIIFLNKVELHFTVEVVISSSKHINCFICVNVLLIYVLFVEYKNFISI